MYRCHRKIQNFISTFCAYANSLHNLNFHSSTRGSVAERSKALV